MRHFRPPIRPTPYTLRLALHVTGAVQGVGFRPFAYRLAVEEGLGGWVRNTVDGVSLEVEGAPSAITRFTARLRAEARPPASIEAIESRSIDRCGETGFRCEESTAGSPSRGRVLPDLVMCEDCRAEISDPRDRRYGYPFSSCTRCGPRFSIVEALPYDRERTSMRDFPMCPACESEYRDQASRRFHAETNACPDCGPQLALRDTAGATIASRRQAMERAAEALRRGEIVALKGLGGFQLLVDARNEAAVARLRERKGRPAKPFAIMALTLDHVRTIASVSLDEESNLRSAAGPIVLLNRLPEGTGKLTGSIAPGSALLGVMLPTTPLHYLLLSTLGFPVVATSGNRSGEAIAADDNEALETLAGIADVFLTHDRRIVNRIDDSVLRMIDGQPTTLRCARGLAPLVIEDTHQAEPVLALGGHLKTSLASGTNGRIILGPHIGDLASSGMRSMFEHSSDQFARLHQTTPARLACDGHPGYATTAFAEASPLPVHQAQHHLAHVLSAMAEHALEGPVLGIAWDGSGHGDDGTLWGGEFLAVDDGRWKRLAHMREFPLPGGERAMREPRRAALGMLSQCYGEALWRTDDIASVASFSPAERELLSVALARKVNAPASSSVGRMFDAVAAILGLSQVTSFEGEAAMAVEYAARRARYAARLPLPTTEEKGGTIRIDWRPMLAALCEKKRDGAGSDALAAGFHDWLAQAACLVAQDAGIEQVVLTGGCFQNALLAERVAGCLRKAGFQPFLHRKVPCNDGGLAVGQAAFAARSWLQETG